VGEGRQLAAALIGAAARLDVPVDPRRSGAIGAWLLRRAAGYLLLPWYVAATPAWWHR